MVVSIPSFYSVDKARAVTLSDIAEDTLASRILPGGTLQFTVIRQP
jgi:hypothetical protein